MMDHAPSTACVGSVDRSGFAVGKSHVGVQPGRLALVQRRARIGEGFRGANANVGDAPAFKVLNDFFDRWNWLGTTHTVSVRNF